MPKGYGRLCRTVKPRRRPSAQCHIHFHRSASDSIGQVSRQHTKAKSLVQSDNRVRFTHRQGDSGKVPTRRFYKSEQLRPNPSFSMFRHDGRFIEHPPDDRFIFLAQPSKGISLGNGHARVSRKVVRVEPATTETANAFPHRRRTRLERSAPFRDSGTLPIQCGTGPWGGRGHRTVR